MKTTLQSVVGHFTKCCRSTAKCLQGCCRVAPLKNALLYYITIHGPINNVTILQLKMLGVATML